MPVSGYSAPAPTRIYKSRALTTARGRQFLVKYLEAASTQPELHPDAQLTHEGPKFASNGPRGGITLHMLRRMERGMDGEVLAPEENEEVVNAGLDEITGEALQERLEEQREDGWQDPEKYALEQAEETEAWAVDVKAKNLESVPEVLATQDGDEAGDESKVEGDRESKKVNKELRRAEKKIKKKMEQKEQERAEKRRKREES